MGIFYTSNGQVRWPISMLFSQRYFLSATEHPSETMQACAYGEHGDASQLEVKRVPRPVCVAGQVLIRVVGAGVNPVDVKLRENPIPREIIPLPKVPGTDVSGVVVAAPEGSKFKAGDKVFAMLQILGQKWGACEELVAADEKLVARAPASIPLLHAAALPLVSLTVLQALAPVVDAFGGVEGARGKHVLVHAGSGGVGSIAVQYCSKVLGMHVSTTTSNAQLARDLGAERVINYKEEDFTKVLGKHSLDVIVDPLSYIYEQPARDAELLRPGGHYVEVASSPFRRGEDADPLGLAIPESRLDRLVLNYVRELISRAPWAAHRLHVTFVHPDGHMLEEVAGIVDAGHLRPVIDEVFTLDRTQAANERVASGRTKGKCVIQLAEEAAVLESALQVDK